MDGWPLISYALFSHYTHQNLFIFPSMGHCKPASAWRVPSSIRWGPYKLLFLSFLTIRPVPHHRRRHFQFHRVYPYQTFSDEPTEIWSLPVRQVRLSKKKSEIFGQIIFGPPPTPRRPRGARHIHTVFSPRFLYALRVFLYSYTLISVPWQSLGPCISDGQDERPTQSYFEVMTKKLMIRLAINHKLSNSDSGFSQVLLGASIYEML